MQSPGRDRLFRAAFDDALHFAVLVSSAGDVYEANRAALELGGCTREDVLGRPFEDAPWWGDSGDARADIRAAIGAAAGGEVVRLDVDATAADRTPVLLELSFKVVHAAEGAPDFVLVEGRDVTEARRAERALRVSEAKFAGIVSIASDAIISVDSAFRIIHFNRGAEQIFRYTAAEVLGQRLDILLPERFRSMHTEHMVRFGAGAEQARRMGERSEIAGRRKGGDEFPADASISKLEIEAERIYTVVLRDVTERKQAEEAQALLVQAGSVLASSLDYETTLDSVVRLVVPKLADFCSIVILEEDGTVRRHGLAHADAALQGAVDRLRATALDADSQHPALHAMRSGTAVRMTHVEGADIRAWSGADEALLHLYERLQPRSVLSIPLRARGHTLGAMTFFSTAADRFGERESELAQSLAARAALAVDNARLYRAAQEAVRTRDDVLAVVSHDLGNPLSAIRIGTSLLLRAMSEEERGTGGWQHLEAIRASTLQMERLIRDLLEVKRIEAGHLALQRRAVAPRALLSELREQFAAVAGEREITLEHELDETLPDVFADRDRTKQALSNLIGNALRFTPPGGRIVLEARAADHEVRFGVRDTGPGIPRDEAAHVFERFWQGRRDGQTGVGLGLAIARGIVQAHGGRIWVDSESGGGAHLLFTLPAFSGESEGGGAVRF